MARLRTLIERAIRPALGTRVGSRQQRLSRAIAWLARLAGPDTDAPSPICPVCRGQRRTDGTRCPTCQGDDT